MTIIQSVNDFLFTGDLHEHYLVKYPSVSICSVALYVVFVKWLGPWLMRDRKPFQLKHTMIAYNFMQCLFNAYILYKFMMFNTVYWKHRCKAKYNPLYPIALEEIQRTSWLICLIKYVDLLDTVFFVLRKKTSQVTFLHIFHHAVVCLMCLWFLKTLQNIGYYLCFGLTINTFVHVVMYFYYGLAAFGPEMQKRLWWKRYLTQMQITQFYAIILYMLHGFVTGCEDHGPIEIISFLFMVSLCLLFLDYYKKDRHKREQKQELERKREQGEQKQELEGKQTLEEQKQELERKQTPEEQKQGLERKQTLEEQKQELERKQTPEEQEQELDRKQTPEEQEQELERKQTLEEQKQEAEQQELERKQTLQEQKQELEGQELGRTQNRNRELEQKQEVDHPELEQNQRNQQKQQELEQKLKESQGQEQKQELKQKLEQKQELDHNNAQKKELEQNLKMTMNGMSPYGEIDCQTIDKEEENEKCL